MISCGLYLCVAVSKFFRVFSGVFYLYIPPPKANPSTSFVVYFLSVYLSLILFSPVFSYFLFTNAMPIIQRENKEQYILISH
jgi:hypothetical protein